MRQTNVAITVVAVGLALCFTAGTARAGGFEIGDQGARAAGRAGAFAARADDLSAIEYNPAGLARLRGTRLYLTNRFAVSSEWYKRARTLDWSGVTRGGIPNLVSFEPVENDVTSQATLPMFVLSSDFGLDDWGFAIGAYGPSGELAQTFPVDGPQRYMLVERETIVLYYSLSAAWKMEETFGVGLSLQWVDVPVMNFSLVVDGNVAPRLVNSIESRFDMHTQFEGADRTGISAVVGAWYRPSPSWEFALSGRVIPVPIDAEGTLSVEALSLDLDEPPTLLRDGVPNNDVTFSFWLPPKLRLGARYIYHDGGRELFDIELDIGWEGWSMVEAFTMDGEGIVSEVLGNEIPIGVIEMPRYWNDTFSFRLGGDLNLVEDTFTVRGGFMYETAAVPDEYAYIDIMSYDRFGPSAGFSLEFGGLDISAAYTYIFQMPLVLNEEDSSVYQQVPASPCEAPYTDTAYCSSDYLGQPAAVANAGTYQSDAHFFSVAMGYEF